MSFLVGLNPYGLCCTIGLQGPGTERGATNPLGLDGFIALGEEIGAACLEMDLRLLESAPRLEDVGRRLHEAGMIPIIATGMPSDHLARVLEVAVEIGSKLIRMSVTPVLCGNRASTANWDEILAASRASLEKWAPIAADAGVDLAIENHQDLTSGELLEIAEAAGPNVAICFDTGNPLAVGEDILPFANRIAHRLRHVHLKDYRAQFTDEGYRLVRCPIGDGCVPFKEIAKILSHKITASIEPGALEARHIRLLTDAWWDGYPPLAARELAGALRTAKRNRLPYDADHRTPWELNATGDEIVAHEKQVFDRSVHNIRQMGWL